jgi:signal transduction histidine kinase/CheY-like chemotaxis protein
LCVIGADGLVLDLTDELASVLGKRPAELIGVPFDELLHVDDRGSSAQSTFEARPVNATERGPFLAWKISQGTSGERRVVATDVTAQRRAARRLVDADRAATLGRLSASLAHQLNNALTYMRLNLGRMLSLELSRRPVSPLRLHRIELLQEVREGIARMDHVVAEVLQFARHDDDVAGTIEVRAALESALRLVSHEIGHRARLIVEHGDPPPVHGRESDLRHVLLHLLLNAQQAIPEGEAHLNEIRVSTGTDASGRATISVTDSGVGIPPELLGGIFEPEFVGRGVRPDLGPRLAICREVVTALGGEIAAESVMGRGTTLRIALPAVPRAEKALRAQSEPERVSEPGHRTRLRILVVDDDKPVAQALAIELGAAHEVVLASSGREALEILDGDRNFDLVLCDLMMPELTGIDVFEALQPVDPELARRMVFMTGGAFTPRAQQFLRTTPAAHIAKPFGPDTLAGLLDEVAKAYTTTGKNS